MGLVKNESKSRARTVKCTQNDKIWAANEERQLNKNTLRDKQQTFTNADTNAHSDKHTVECH